MVAVIMQIYRITVLLSNGRSASLPIAPKFNLADQGRNLLAFTALFLSRGLTSSVWKAAKIGERCQSGRMSTLGKRVYLTVPRVRIPPSPPNGIFRDFAAFGDEIGDVIPRTRVLNMQDRVGLRSEEVED